MDEKASLTVKMVLAAETKDKRFSLTSIRHPDIVIKKDPENFKNHACHQTLYSQENS